MKTPNADRAVVEGFRKRAARANLLAAPSESARAPLEFAAGLYKAQALFADAIAATHRRRPLAGMLRVDLSGFLDGARGVLRFVAASGPATLAEVARDRLEESSAPIEDGLLRFWHATGGAAQDYLSRAALRPYAEVLVSLGLRPDRTRRPEGACPFCGAAPWIAARRAASPDADGAQRYLACSLCGSEWIANRLRCPACSETDPNKLPSFGTDTFPAVRIEACEGCRRYVKSLDLTVDGRLIPEVDDLASISMDLWAAEQGFARLEPGLAGV